MARKLPATKRGFFLSLEGGEGSGKSTLIRSIEEFLEQEGYEVLITREPGGPKIGEAIRDILLDTANGAMDPLTELYLYLASRRQNVVERIRPHLATGGVVISDRFADASVAYQGGGRELGLERVDKLNEATIEECVPDLTFFLDIDPVAGLARGPGRRSSEADRIEREALSFHRRVRESYRLWAERHPRRIKVLDAGVSADEVAGAAIAAIGELVKLRGKTVD
jgi:dTMP kinase